MKLFHSPPSPFVRMAMIAAHELGLADRIELVPTQTTAFSTPDALKAANPLGKIPCLVLDDGRALYDSRVILRYLDALGGGRRLYPAGDEQWTVLTLEATGQGIADCAVSIAYEHRLRDPGERSDKWMSAQRSKISRALDALERDWIDHLERSFDAGAVAVGASLAYLDFRRELVNVDRVEGRPRLAAWFERVSARESFQATDPLRAA